jgi:enoyl-[acyl-carrier protein] reductase II
MASTPSSVADREREARTHLERLWSRGSRFLGCRHAIMGGAMTWVSERHLVSAISNGGGFGVIATGSMSPDQLSTEIAETKRLTAQPFGVNIITMHPQLEHLIDVCLDHKVGHVVLAGGLPSGSAMQRVKRGGAKLMCFAPALVLAKKLVRSGADALVIEGMEAGGHIGPVATSVLAQEILPEVRDVPIFVAGGIGRGEAILGYLEMGASGVQLGTRFVCASESIAHAKFKQAFIRASARDAVPSVQLDPRFPVIPVRAIANAATRRFLETQREVIDKFGRGELDQKAASLEIEHFWAGSLRRAVIDGDVETGSLMAGQSVGMVTGEQPTAAILEELVDQAARALAARAPASRPATGAAD